MRKKKIIYASSAMREEDFSDLFKNAAKIPGQQAQKFNRLMIKGFAKNGADVYVISSPPINKSNCSARIKLLGKKKTGGVCYRYLPIFNFQGIKNVIVLISSFLHTFFGAIGKDAAIVCDVLNISVAMGAVNAGRLLRKRCVGIVTDIPELMVTGHTDKMVKYCYKIIGKCTDYVFLTDAMNDRLNPENKPYTIVEGVCDEDLDYDSSPVTGKRPSALYAGLLDAEYGVKSMVEAFLQAEIPNSALHICGNGPYVEELKQIAASHDNIVYHGILLNKDVITLEKQVSLLVNPRPSVGEFTKFSFPSKNMEYMTSGTPVLATKLPGIPDEYYNYIYTFLGETVEEMAQSFKDILSLPQESLTEKGLQAYKFVTEHKNSQAQAKKVLDLINK